MAKAKKAKREVASNFPKEQGVVGEGDRFIPPDRADQIPNEDGDRAQVFQVKSLADNLEVIDDAGGGDEGGGDEDRHETHESRDRFENEDDGAVVEDEEDDGDRGRRGRGSRKVRARINRERALKQQANIRAENAERRAQGVEARLAKLERVTTEVSASTEVKTLEAKLEAIKKELEAAVEAGETKKQLDAQIRLGDVQADLKLAKRDMEAARRKAIDDEAARKETSAAGTGDAGVAEPSATEYMQANRAWWGKAKFAREKRRAVALDTEILDEIDEGEHDFEKYSEEHFELLNERLAEQFPDLPLHTVDGEPYVASSEDDEEDEEVSNRDRDRDSRGEGRERQNNRRPPVGGQGTRNSGRRQLSDADLARQGKVRLDQADFTQMRMYGLDPNNPKQKTAFAKERMRTILTDEKKEQRRGNQRSAR